MNHHKMIIPMICLSILLTGCTTVHEEYIDSARYKEMKRQESEKEAEEAEEAERHARAESEVDARLAELANESTYESSPKYSLKHGTLVSATENDVDGKKTLVVKAKITSSINNSTTVSQNYMNVFDLIQNQGCDKYDEIQYWAVADMSSGNEEKVVSFTVDKNLIQKIKNDDIVDIQLGDYAKDLYIHSSLQ